MVLLHADRPELIAARVSGAGRILLFGESGIGKSTLAADLARHLGQAGRPCLCIGADPGSPSFGAPGAVCLGRWQPDGWQLTALEALCTLDAGRFRLPLVSAVMRLAQNLTGGLLLVDAPGITRGVAGAELLSALVEAAAAETVLVLAREERKLPLANELATCGCEVLFVRPAVHAHLPRKQQRARQRTRLWDAYLLKAGEKIMPVPERVLTGTPPPLDAAWAWRGRQIALLRDGQTLAIGEILDFRNRTFQLRIAGTEEAPDQLLVRDACRNGRGILATCRPAEGLTLTASPPDVAPAAVPAKSTGPCPVVRIGEATAALVNGIFGDPLLHLRLHNRKRSFLFDLGEGSRLPARLAHQVTDVFISHAHIDHICGFMWLLRSRIGLSQSCRLFGPPGLADCIAGLLNGIRWDRIGENGPRFEVGELQDDHLLVYGLQAGREEKVQLAARPAPGGLLFAEPDCLARAVSLAHGGIPVLAYALELAPRLNVREESLVGLAPGPWLGELKKHLAAGDRQALIPLPDGSIETAGSLAEAFILITPARKLAYATDLSDTLENRAKLIGLAREAQLLICEAAFLAADQSAAELSGHLTAKACGEIAKAAGVVHLVPFHFSRRYEQRPLQVHAEVEAACQQVIAMNGVCFSSTD